MLLDYYQWNLFQSKGKGSDRLREMNSNYGYLFKKKKCSYLWRATGRCCRTLRACSNWDRSRSAEVACSDRIQKETPSPWGKWGPCCSTAALPPSGSAAASCRAHCCRPSWFPRAGHFPWPRGTAWRSSLPRRNVGCRRPRGRSQKNGRPLAGILQNWI